MVEINLRFFGESAELSRIEFRDNQRDFKKLVRGKTNGAINADGTFQWTNAVKAFSVLLLKCKLENIENGKLIGDKNSLASSLDYAISKPPTWIKEIFSNDPNDNSQVRKFFKRTNPERKLPGPVIVSLNPVKFSNSSINFIFNNEIISDRTKLKTLLNLLENNLAYSEVNQNNVTKKALEILSAHTNQEIFSSLSRLDLISKYGSELAVSKLTNIPGISKLIKNHKAILNQFTNFSRIPEASCSIPPNLDAKLRSQPILVVTSCVQIGFLALMNYLKVVKGYPIDIDYLSFYGVDVAKKLEKLDPNSQPVLASTGVGPTHKLLNKKNADFSPLMLGPLLSHQFLEHGVIKKQEKLKGELIIANEEPTSSHFYTDTLEAKDLIDKNRFRHMFLEPDEVTSLAVSGEHFYSSQWFPHYVFHKEILGATEIIKDPDATKFSEISLVICNQWIDKDLELKLALRLALRDAWINLLENPAIISKTAHSILNAANYEQVTLRSAGIYHINRLNQAA